MSYSPRGRCVCDLQVRHDLLEVAEHFVRDRSLELPEQGLHPLDREPRLLEVARRLAELALRVQTGSRHLSALRRCCVGLTTGDTTDVREMFTIGPDPRPEQRPGPPDRPNDAEG